MKTQSSTMKYTPGPWYVVEYAGFLRLQKEPNYSDKDLLDSDDYETAFANATLAASAPDLLGALQTMVEAFWFNYTESDKDMFRNEFPNSRIIKAEQAIKKATGE